jgi:hypothetical protein
MHRCGTSALTRVLNLLGCGLPDNLIGAGFGNEVGHWEPKSLVLFNDDLLASAGSRWDDWQQLNPNWYKSSIYASYKEQARDLLLSEFQNFPLFVFKDPRILQILPFWLNVLEAENIDAKIVIPVRHPDEVAASLELRDMMDLSYGRLLWLRRLLDAERDSRGHSRIFCTYNQLLRDWRSVIANIENGLDIAFPRRSALVDQEVEAFLSDNLRHQIADRCTVRGGDGVSTWLQRIHALLSEWSDHGENPGNIPELDIIRAEFDEASRQFASVILPGSRSGEAGDGRRRLNELTAEIEELTRDLTEAQADLAKTGLDLAQLSVERDEILLQSRRLTEEASARDDALRDHEAQISALQDAVNQAEAQALEKVSEAVQTAKREVSTMSQERDRAHAERDRLQDRLALTENILRQREEEIDQTRAELAVQKGISDELSGKYEGALKDVRKLSGEASALKAKLSAGHVEIAQLTRMLRQSEEDMSATQDDIQWLQSVADLLSNYPAWWHFLPRKWLDKRIHRRLATRGLFNKQTYLERYPDVAAAGLEPLQHYLSHGMAEKRSRFFEAVRN